MNRLTLIALLLAVSAANAKDASKKVDDDRVKAQTQIVAAIECAHRGFPYMKRVSVEYVTCLASPVGIKDTVAVIDVLRAPL